MPTPEERELETIFEAKEESEAWAVQGLLQSAGIETVVQSREAPQDILPGVGNIAVRVGAEQAQDARAIVASYRNNPPRNDEMQSAEVESAARAVTDPSPS